MSATELTDKLVTGAARRGEYHGAPAVAAYSNAHHEFAALCSSCGIYDLGWRAKITLTGSDRVRWLNGMITNNVRDLAPGRGVYAFLLNPQGRILADLYAHNRGDYLLVDTDQSQVTKLLEIFDHYIIMDDVEVSNASDKLTAIGLAGPKAREVLHSAGIDIAALEPLQPTDLTWQDMGVTVVRTDNEITEAFEIWLAPNNVSRLWDVLLKSGATPVGFEALEQLRIAAGIPSYGQDIRERDLPQETSQDRALHFSKGCYVGQEIVERIRSRGNVHRKFAGFQISGPLPAPGDKIQLEGKDVGEITSVAALPGPQAELPVALGYIRREAAQSGKQFDIGSAKATERQLPFAEFLKN
jgi:folate-binding protein YgfZ